MLNARVPLPMCICISNCLVNDCGVICVESSSQFYTKTNRQEMNVDAIAKAEEGHNSTWGRCIGKYLVGCDLIVLGSKVFPALHLAADRVEENRNVDRRKQRS